jgi:Uma2 family endonuclease
VWLPTAALVVEVVSPGDETYDKLHFHARHKVDGVLIVDPAKQTVEWLALADDQYAPVERSSLIEVAVVDLERQIDWP